MEKGVAVKASGVPAKTIVMFFIIGTVMVTGVVLITLVGPFLIVQRQLTTTTTMAMVTTTEETLVTTEPPPQTEWVYAFGCTPPWELDYTYLSQCKVTLMTFNTSTTVFLMRTTSNTTIELTSGITHVESFPILFQVEGGIEDKGVIIISPDPLFVAVEATDSDGTPTGPYIDATQLLPFYDFNKQDLYEYILLSFIFKSSDVCEVWNVKNFFVIATAYHSEITVYKNGLSNSFELEPLQSYSELSVSNGQDPQIDFTGYKITSTNQVSIIAGNRCVQSLGSFGPMVSSVMIFVPPLMESGPLVHEYMTPLIDNGHAGYYVRALSKQDSNEITVGGMSTSQDRFEFVEYDFSNKRGLTYITCTLSCEVAIISIGKHNDYGTMMMTITPRQEFYDFVYFATLDFDDPDPAHYVSVVAIGEYRLEDILLNGVSLGTDGWGVGNGFAYTTKSINSGTYNLQSTNGRRFAAYVYCHLGEPAGASGGYGFSVVP